MDITQWIVSVVGIVLMFLTIAYFLTPKKVRAAKAPLVNGVQEQHVLVKGGYHPSFIGVAVKKPVRLIFERNETTSCSEEIVLPEFGIRKFLPQFQQTVVEFTPTKKGTFEFACGMNMLHGKIEVK